MNKLKVNNVLTIQQEILPLLAITLIVLVGYYKIFLGANFFLYEELFTATHYFKATANGSGWRPDIGLGISTFFGGPDVWHPWSIPNLLVKIMPSRVFQNIFSVVVLGILVSYAMYYFMRRITPDMNKWVVVLLSPMIVFCSNQPNAQFLRAFVAILITSALIFVLLHDYFNAPRAIHLFLMGLLFWFLAFFGTLHFVPVLMIVGLFFSLFYFLYHKRGGKDLIKKIFVIYSFAFGAFVLLSFAHLYTLFLEMKMFEYVRSKATADFTINLIPDLTKALSYFMSLLQVSWIPYNHNFIGSGIRVPPFGWSYNISVIFPLILVFYVFRRSENIWEFSLKWLILFYLICEFLIIFMPGFAYVYRLICSGAWGLFGLYRDIFPMELGLIALFLFSMREQTILIGNKWGRRVQIAVAVFLLLFFLALVVLCLTSLLSPKILPSLAHAVVQNYFPQQWGKYPNELMREAVSYNVERFVKVMNLPSLMFYLTSLLLIIPFLKDAWLKRVSTMPKITIAMLLLLNNILLSWSVYPLNYVPLEWDRDSLRQLHFQPTDRFYFVRDISQKIQPTLEELEKTFRHSERRAEGLIGFMEPPGLNVSGLKSFETTNEQEFFDHVFNGDGIKRLTQPRLYYGGPIFHSSLMDMAAIDYYYSEREFPEVPEGLTLYHKEKQMYIYKNESAWPYFYLAKHLSIQPEGVPLKEAERNTAYLNQKDMFDLPRKAGSAKIHLKKFSFGELFFDVDGNNEELLVVADAWHPFWRAQVEGHDVPVIKANEVFKAVKLPAGKYQLRLFFDPQPYRKGIPVAIISWILFLIGFVVAWKNRNKPLFAMSVTK